MYIVQLTNLIGGSRVQFSSNTKMYTNKPHSFSISVSDHVRESVSTPLLTCQAVRSGQVTRDSRFLSQ